MAQPQDQCDLERSENEGFGQESLRERSQKRCDDLIRLKIRSAFMTCDAFDASDIGVRVENGRVTLQGYVPSAVARAWCEQTCDANAGVEDVIDLLRIQST